MATRISSRFSRVGACTTAAVPPKVTTPMRVLARLVGYEGLGGGLRRRHPAGSHVRGAHAAGYVHGQDHGSCWDGRVTTAAGRATAVIRSVSASRKRTAGCGAGTGPRPWPP